MKEKRNWNTEAKLLWDLLTTETTTHFYSDASAAIGIHHRAIRLPLGLIQNYCIENDLPMLNSLCIGKQSKSPGIGYKGTTDLADEISLVKLYEWNRIENPFDVVEVEEDVEEEMEDFFSFEEEEIS